MQDWNLETMRRLEALLDETTKSMQANNKGLEEMSKFLETLQENPEGLEAAKRLIETMKPHSEHIGELMQFLKDNIKQS